MPILGNKNPANYGGFFIDCFANCLCTLHTNNRLYNLFLYSKDNNKHILRENF